MELDGNESSDKPRRLEEDTTNYLCQIELRFTDKIDNEEKAILIENVLSEIKTRTASATCDRRTNFLMEKICYAANLPNLLEITKRCSPYGVFLARNRYSSHVLQAIIARLCFILKFEDFGDVETSEVQDVVLAFATPILKEISWLGREMGASHVLRSLFCLLAGMPVVAERKGKNSKHQHSISLSEPLDNMIETGKFYISKSACFSVPTCFHDLLVEATVSLLSVKPREIQVMIADSSCCAVLGLLVRILSNPALLSEERGPDLAHQLYRLALEWEEGSGATCTASASNVFYAMAGDRSGSYFLESLVECCNVSFLVPLLSCTVVGKAREYSDDSAANFVIQAALRRLSAEAERSLTTVDKLSKQQLQESEELNDIADLLLEELTSAEYFPSLVAQRGGVLLWLLELAQYKQDRKWAENIGSGLIDAWIAVGTELEDTSAASQSREMKLSAALNKRFQLVVAAEGVTKDDGKTASTAANKNKKGGPANAGPAHKGPDVDSAQLLCARLVGYLLKSPAPSVSAVAGSALSKLSPDTLKYIATSGPLSRAVMDVFFKHFSTSSEFKALGAALTIHAVELADHYVGQHVVRRSFECCDLRGKEKWAMLLSAAKDKLQIRKEGRSLLQVVNAELYSRDPTEWRSLLKKQAKAAAMLQDLEMTTSVPPSSSSKGKTEMKSTSSNNTQQSVAVKEPSSVAKVIATALVVDDNAVTANGDESGGKSTAGRKRKRKRAAGGAAGQGGKDEEEE